MVHVPVETVLTQVLLWVVTGVLGWIVGRMASAAKSDKREREALYSGMQCLLRAELVDKHDRYVNNKEPMRYYDRKNLEQVYFAYKGLKGNGLGDKLWKEIEELDLSGND